MSSSKGAALERVAWWIIRGGKWQAPRRSRCSACRNVGGMTPGALQASTHGSMSQATTRLVETLLPENYTLPRHTGSTSTLTVSVGSPPPRNTPLIGTTSL